MEQQEKVMSKRSATEIIEEMDHDIHHLIEDGMIDPDKLFDEIKKDYEKHEVPDDVIKGSINRVLNRKGLLNWDKDESNSKDS